MNHEVGLLKKRPNSAQWADKEGQRLDVQFVGRSPLWAHLTHYCWKSS